MIRLIVAIAAVVLAALSGVVAYRTWSFAAAAPAAAVSVPDPGAYHIDAAAAAQRLAQAVRFNTVSLTAPADDPAGFVQFHAWLRTTYPALHAAAQAEPVGLSLLYTWQGSDPAQPPLLLLAHQDTVPVPADTRAAWRVDPFAGIVADGAVWGRGAIDDKSSLIAIMEAAETLAAAGKKPRRTILLAFGHDEEISGQNGAAQIAALLQRRGVHAWFALDEGLVTIAEHPLTGGPASLIGVSEKGFGTLRVTATGQPGHSSTPSPETAVSRLAEAITAIHRMPVQRSLEGGPALDMMRALAPELSLTNRVALANEWLFAPLLRARLAGEPRAQALIGTTIAPTVVSGGARANVLPAQATALINLRIHPRDNAADLLRRARAAVADIDGVRVVWDEPPYEPSPVSDARASSYALIAALARRTYPDAPVAPGLVIGATDSRRYAGVAENIYRYQALELTNADIETIHGINEHVSIENYARMIRFYLGLMEAGAM